MQVIPGTEVEEKDFMDTFRTYPFMKIKNKYSGF